jgi:uncharacterized MAPEG superfamily protein
MAETWGLVGASLLLALAWLPASVAKQQTYGNRWLASNRRTEGLPPLPEWGQRAVRAHDNLKENFPAWAALLLLVIVMDWQSTATAWAAILFPLARLGHMASYIAGQFWPRFIFFCIGLACTLVLAGVCVVALV